MTHEPCALVADVVEPADSDEPRRRVAKRKPVLSGILCKSLGFTTLFCVNATAKGAIHRAIPIVGATVQTLSRPEDSKASLVTRLIAGLIRVQSCG